MLVVVALAAGGCGGESTVAADIEPEPTATREPTPTPIPVVVPTSTPLPTPTALPTSTPIPLPTPTPGAVLLTTAFTNHSKITTSGIGSIQWGLTPEEAAERQNTTWVGEPTGGICYPITPENGPDGVTLWVVYGFVERVDVSHPEIRTRSGYGIGNTGEELRGQLGDRLEIIEHQDGTATATFTPSDPVDREFRIVFELDADGVVTSLRSGRALFIDGAAAC